MMIMLLAGLQGLPREILEAARVDGATKWPMFWKMSSSSQMLKIQKYH